MLPRGAGKGDWELELGVVIGTTCPLRDTRRRAPPCEAGYVLVNDVSERAYQKELGSQWDKGKGCDTFGPVGPWLVTGDEVGDPQNLEMWLDLNGNRIADRQYQDNDFWRGRIDRICCQPLSDNAGGPAIS